MKPRSDTETQLISDGDWERAHEQDMKQAMAHELRRPGTGRRAWRNSPAFPKEVLGQTQPPRTKRREAATRLYVLLDKEPHVHDASELAERLGMKISYVHNLAKDLIAENLVTKTGDRYSLKTPETMLRYLGQE